MPIYKLNANLQIANKKNRPIRNSRNWHKIRIGLASPGGFTLLEMIVSLGIFAALVVIAIGAVLAISNAHLKAVNIQSIQDNLRFALESMTKEMRTGSRFILGAPLAIPAAYREVYFTRSDGVLVGYCLQNLTLVKVIGTTSCTGSAVSSDDIVVEELVFYVLGAIQGPSDGQPRITVFLRARTENPKLATTFQLQTTLTPRIRDL